MLERKIEFMGMEIAPCEIKNPHLRRAIEQVSGTTYKFSYDDHSRHKWNQYTDTRYDDKYHESVHYSDYSDYYRHWG